MIYNLLGSIIGAFCSSLLMSMVFGHYYILLLRKRLAAKVREYVPESHHQKNGTPTMGGLYLLAVIFINTFLWCRVSTCFVWVIFFAMTAFGGIGLLDDWHKLYYQRGLSAKQKFMMQWLAALASVYLLVQQCGVPPVLTLAGYTQYAILLSFLFYFWAAFVMVSASNAVNLTDGLDGLAIAAYIPSLVLFIFLFASAAGIATFIPYLTVVNASMLALFAALLCGTCLGFLWHNAYPAQLFMGDVGSLSLGAGLAALAIVAKAELLLPFIAIIFVVEVLSVILQVLSVRHRGKRIFRMSPLHHHFELSGMHENSITVRAMLISCVACSFVACFLVYSMIR